MYSFLFIYLFYYRFCGPGTKLKKRLARGDRGINNLDELAREHDIAYDKSNSLSDRHKADEILENQAWEVFKGDNSGLKEKAAAWLVTTAMKLKRKIGAGYTFKSGINDVRKSIKNHKGEKNLMKLAKLCVAAAKKSAIKNKIKKLRIIPIPKKGGVLPLIPIFAGLSALGALTGGIANVVKTASEFNRTTPTLLGKGLYLTPYKGGSFKITKRKSLKKIKKSVNKRKKSKKTKNTTTKN